MRFYGPFCIHCNTFIGPAANEKEKSPSPTSKTESNSVSENFNGLQIAQGPGSKSDNNSEIKTSTGWDDDANDDWGDMNEADDKGNNDGWEDNDDWGSLEAGLKTDFSEQTF